MLQPTLSWVAISEGEDPDRDGVQTAEETSTPDIQVFRFQSSPQSTRAQESQVN